MDEEALYRRIITLERRIDELSRLDQNGPRLLSRTLLTGAVASIDIQNISQNYKNLQLRLYARGDTAAGSIDIYLTFNNDGGANYDRQYLYASAAVTAAGEGFGLTSIPLGRMPAATAGAGLYNQWIIDINNYSNSSYNKLLSFTHARKDGVVSGNLFIVAQSGFWRSNNAINRITFTTAAGNFDVGTLVEIYGIP